MNSSVFSAEHTYFWKFPCWQPSEKLPRDSILSLLFVPNGATAGPESCMLRMLAKGLVKLVLWCYLYKVQYLSLTGDLFILILLCFNHSKNLKDSIGITRPEQKETNLLCQGQPQSGCLFWALGRQQGQIEQKATNDMVVIFLCFTQSLPSVFHNAVFSVDQWGFDHHLAMKYCNRHFLGTHHPFESKQISNYAGRLTHDITHDFHGLWINHVFGLSIFAEPTWNHFLENVPVFRFSLPEFFLLWDVLATRSFSVLSGWVPFLFFSVLCWAFDVGVVVFAKQKCSLQLRFQANVSDKSTCCRFSQPLADSWHFSVASSSQSKLKFHRLEPHFFVPSVSFEFSPHKTPGQTNSSWWGQSSVFERFISSISLALSSQSRGWKAKVNLWPVTRILQLQH